MEIREDGVNLSGDYSKYQFTKKELVENVLMGFFLVALIVYLFYQSLIAVIIFSIPFEWWYLRRKRIQLMERRKWQLNIEFKECISSLSGALSAGYSMENAFGEVIKDLSLLYPREADIMLELERIHHQIKVNITVEELLLDFAIRSGVEDIMSFAQVFTTAKRVGGDMIKIIKHTVDNMSGRMEIRREIETMITAKKFENRIMTVIPLAIILYLWIFSPGYLDPLYHNAIGVGFMTAALGLYALAFILCNRLMRIEM